MTQPTHVSVLVRLRGFPVETRLLPLQGELRVGEAPDARVGFPGGTVVVRRDSLGRWRAGAHVLGLHRPVVLRFGPVEVTFEAVVESPSARALDSLPAFGPAVVTLAVLLLVGAADAAGRVLRENPEITAHLEALVLGPPPAEAPEAPALPEPDPWPPVVELLQPPTP